MLVIFFLLSNDNMGVKLLDIQDLIYSLIRGAYPGVL
jgi:hypothetical protein